MKNNNLEDLFKDSFENFEADVNPNVWKNIKAGIKEGDSGVLAKFKFNKIGVNAIVAIVSSVAAIIGTLLVMNLGSSNSDKSKAVNSENNSVVDKKAVPSQQLSADEKAKSVKGNVQEENAPTVQNINESLIATEQKTDNKVVNVKNDKQKINSIINTLSDEPVALINASPIGGTVPLFVNLSNKGIGKTNKWTFNDGKKSTTSANPVHVFENPGIYTVILTSTNSEGKVSIDSVEVEVTGNSSISSIPTEFSPNGDKINDEFVFKSQFIANMTAVIFDKNGNIIYTWEGEGKWDGKDLKGKNVKIGTYFYLISAVGIDGKKFEQKGSINLTR
jgi:gliding motility-associated-like protein